VSDTLCTCDGGLHQFNRRNSIEVKTAPTFSVTTPVQVSTNVVSLSAPQPLHERSI